MKYGMEEKGGRKKDRGRQLTEERYATKINTKLEKETMKVTGKEPKK